MDQKKKAGGERGVLMGKTSPQLEAFRLPWTRGEAMGRIEYHQEIMVIVGDLENAEEMMGILGEVKYQYKFAWEIEEKIGYRERL